MIDSWSSPMALAEPARTPLVTTPTLAIVIVNYNTGRVLAPCLDAITASRITLPLRVIVVDNASTDGTVDLLARAYPWVEVIVSPHNGGYAYANNLALRRLIAAVSPDQDRRHAYLLLLNPDTTVAPDTLVRMVDFLETMPAAGVVGPRLVLPDGRLDLACRRLFPTPRRAFFRLLGLSRLFPRSRHLAGYNLTYLDPDQTTEVDSVVGAFMLVRREAISQAGLLDEAFFMYGEDLDWAMAIHRAGWQVRYNPAVTVLHVKRAASRQSHKAQIAFHEAMLYFYRKHYAAHTPGWLGALVVAGIRLNLHFTRLRERFVRRRDAPQPVADAA